jgi:hypothetical protein
LWVGVTGQEARASICAWKDIALLPAKHESAGVSAGHGMDVIEAMRDGSFKRPVIVIYFIRLCVERKDEDYDPP